ncbi:MAG: hypothetical protein IT435_12630 [Phycisphaerales bacterium]|nr:hypothetical protein [Phycisphaerales bacterium]
MTLDHNASQNTAPQAGSPADCGVRLDGSASGAAVLRRVCGAPAAYRRSRRGSFLVLVIGVLALISAFMVIYVAVGRSDQQLSSSVKRAAIGLSDAPDGRAGESYRDAVAEKFAKYAAEVIGNDSVATFYTDSGQRAIAPDGQPVNGNPIRLSREASDYPYTDWNKDSTALITDPAKYFDAVGTYRPEMGDTGVPQVWKPSDPWLASSEPVWLNYDAVDDPSSAANEYLLQRDWAQITNIAPDGQFVNLYYLRGSAANYLGNFGATHEEMRQKLFLFDASNSTTTTTDFGVNAASRTAQPAYWTMRQRGAAMPVGSQFDGAPGGTIYRPYSWADADGNGIYDSRWFEMRDARLSTGYDPGNTIDVLGIDDGKYRYFFAARIVDLSGRVNVTTAGDFTAPPDTGTGGVYAAGSSPADIDLRRLLGMGDSWFNIPQLSYSQLAQNSSNANDPASQNYLGYWNGSTPDLTSIIGNRSYLAMGFTLNRGTPAALNDVNLPNLTRFGNNTDSAGAEKRWEHYKLVGSSTDGIFENTTGNNTYDKTVIKNPYGVSDLIELLTYDGVNDPSYTSQLEGAGGKYEGTNASTPDPLFMRYSPFRDNRPLSVEKMNVPDGNMTTAREREIFAQQAVDVRHRLSTITGARPIKTGPVPVVMDPDTNQWEISADELQSTELKAPSGSVTAANAFKLYADGLVPYTADIRTWPANTDFAKYRFLNYGYRSPEVGIRMAAQMAVNLAGMRTNNVAGAPEMLTVPLWDDMADDSHLGADSNNNNEPIAWKNRQFKWSGWPYTSNRGRLDGTRLSGAAADNAGDKLTADAVNVYGVTAHPIITQAACFAIFVDAEGTKDPADSDVYKITYPAGAPEVEITGARTKANSDFIGEVFAVHLTNPFPVTITLGTDILGSPTHIDPNQVEIWRRTNHRYDYYIEYAGRYYRLADWYDNGTPDDFTDDEPMQSTLAPGQSRVFYFSSFPLETMEDRLRSAVDTAEEGLFPAQTSSNKHILMDRWISTQLDVTGSGKPVRMEQFKPLDGEPQFSRTTAASNIPMVDITSPAQPMDPTKLVRLWRAIRDDYSDNLGNANELWDVNSQDPNDPSTYAELPDQNLLNDLLVDRLRDPEGGKTWRAPVKAGANKVVGSHGWDWDSDPDELDNDENDNRPSAMAFTLGGLVSRRSDDKDKNIDKTGMLPAYMLESAFGSTNLTNTSTRTYDPANPFSLSGTQLDQRQGGARFLYKEDGDTPYNNGRESWLGTQAYSVDGSIQLPIYNPLVNSPKDWMVQSETATGQQLADGPAAIPSIPRASPVSFDSVRPMMWGRMASAKMRSLDVLLPLAIGAQVAYKVNAASPTPGEIDQHWLTLGESWALALNYEFGNTNLANDKLWKVYKDFGEVTPTTPVYPVTDGGRVVIGTSYTNTTIPAPGEETLTAFVPFVDSDGNGFFDRDATEPNREDLSLGLSPAMAIVEQFTALTAGGSPSLRKAQYGLVNLNTAPIAVKRVLPMLSPTLETLPGYQWWWTGQTGNSELDGDVDLAATLIAYRDKVMQRRRPDPANASTPGPTVSFDDRDNAGNPGADITQDDQLNGRSGRSDFNAIREQPGLLAASEIMGATRRYQAPNVATAMPARDNANIDLLGWDENASGKAKLNADRKGVGSLDYTDADAVKNDYEFYEDKLLVTNGVLNTVSTRSDYFAVWFVVAGFKASDVRGLSMSTPMVPSIQRRYVMVVDRSNVVKKGDKARIVFFREVPM